MIQDQHCQKTFCFKYSDETAGAKIALEVASEFVRAIDLIFRYSYRRVNLCVLSIHHAFHARLNLLLGDTAGQSLHLLLEELLSALPDRRASAVLQREQTGQQRIAECLRRLPGQRRRQVVNRDDTQRRPVALDLDLDGRLVKCSVDVVDGDRVVRVRRVAADIADNTELAARRLEALAVDKRRDGLGQVDAVDEYVRLDDLGVRPVTLLGLGQIPLLDLGAADLLKQVDGARAAAAQRAEDQAGGLAAGDLLAGGDVLLQLRDQVGFGVVVTAALGEGLDAGERLAVGVCELPGPGLVVSARAQIRRQLLNAP